MWQNLGIFQNGCITARISRFFFSFTLVLLMCIPPAHSAGYTCDSSKVYSSCNETYYLDDSTSQCLSCPTGCTCAGGTDQPVCSSTVTFDLAGGDWGATSTTQTVANNSTMTIVYDHFPSRAGYTFGGFYTGQNCTGTQYFNGESDSYYQLVSVLPFASDTSLYACWNTCPEGSYCPGGSIYEYESQQISCPAGTSAAGSDAESDCMVTVTFKTGNTTLGTQQVAYNTATILTPEAAFTAPVSSAYGWGFDGWATAPNTTASYIDIDTVTLTGDITLYGVWSRNVSFIYYNGASATSTTTSKRTQYYQNTSATAADVGWVGTYPLTTQTTYNWEPVGWVLNSTTSTTPTSTATTTELVAPAADAAATYYALYKRTATISYDGNGNTGGSTASTTGTQYYNAGGSAAAALTMTLATNGFTKTGYTFDDWDGTYIQGSTFTFPNTAWASSGTYSLAAEWMANQYTVSFSANGGSGGQTANVTATYDSAMPSISTTKPTRSGCKFMGWYDNATYTSGTQYYTAAGASARTWNKTANTTLYAGWSCMTVSAQAKSLTYNGNAQSCATTFTVSGPSSYTVEYSTSSTGTYSATAPTLTNVGSTTVYYEVAATDYTPYQGSYTCTMGKATMDASLAGNSKTYDGSALTCDGGTQSNVPSDSTITYSTTNGSGYSATKPTVTNVADSKTIYYKITNSNYYDFTGSFSCTVNKADWEEMGVGHSKVYDGTSMTCTGLLDEDAPSGATIEYGTTEGTYNLTTAPTATSVADSKTVYFQVTHPNYVTQTGSFSCTITRATGKTVLGATSGTLTYPTTSGSFTASCSENATPEVSLSTTTYASASYSSGKVNTTWKAADGTTTITVSCHETTNYNASSDTYTLYTKKAENPITISTDKGTIAYPDSGTFTVSGAQGTVTVSSDATGVATASLSSSTVTVKSVKPGSATITVTAAGNSYYYSGSKTYTATVVKGTNPITLSASSGTVAYPNTSTFTISGAQGTVTATSGTTGVATVALSSDSKTVTMTPVKAGTSTITVTAAGNDYYNSGSKTYALTVNRGTCSISVSPTSATITYPVTSATFTVDKGNCNGTLSASSSATGVATVGLSGTTGTVTWKSAGSATITVTSAQSDQYDAATATYTVTTKKGTNTLELSETSGTLSYNASTKTKTLTVSKNTSGGTLSVASSATGVATAAISGTTVTMTYAKAGTATITVTSAETDYYNAASATYALTVNCGAGYYSKSASCTICPVGTYTSAANTASSCTNVTAGCYADSTGSTKACPNSCEAGTYSTGGASACSTITNGCYGSAGATSACPNNCNELTAPAVTGGTFSSVTPRSADTACRYVAPSKTITGCSSVTANTVSYSGSAWDSGYYSVSASGGYIIANNNSASATCSQCAAGKYSAGGTATSCGTCANWTYSSAGASSCAACLDVEDGWTKASGTGWTSYSNCKETKTGDAISTYCSAGVLTKTQSSATAWGESKITTALQADAGSIVSGQTCSQCAAGKYSAGGTATSCGTCDNWTYSSAGAASCSSCPAVPDAVSGVAWTKATGTGWDAVSDCVVTQTPANCASGSVKRVASNSTTWGSTTLVSQLKSSAGYYASSTATSCTICPAGSYCPANATSATACTTGSYTSTTGESACTACTGGKTTSGTGKTSCDATCSNATGVSGWETASWSANTVANLCTVAATAGCSANYYKNSNACSTCSSGTNSKYTKSAAGTTTVNNCYLSTTAGKYVATAGAGETACVSPYYCTGGTTVYYGGTHSSTHLTTGGNDSCTDLNEFYTKSLSGASATEACYGTTTGGYYVSEKYAGDSTKCSFGDYCPVTDIYYGETGGNISCASVAGGLYTESEQGTESPAYCYAVIPAGEYIAKSTDSATTECTSGYYCPGSVRETYGDGTAVNQGRNSCATDTGSRYPNSDAGATAMTLCYSNTKQRAMTSCTQNACSNPDTTGCASVTCASSCTCAGTACDYVAYSNSNGLADGTVKSGCSTNVQSCTKDVASLTAKADYYVNGTTNCPLCSSFANGLYPNSTAGNSSGKAACFTNSLSGKVIATANATTTTDCDTKYYKEAHTVNYGSTSSCSSCPATASGSDNDRDAETDCYVSCSDKSIDNGTTTIVNSKEYYNGSTYPACTYNVNCDAKYGASGNKTVNPACTVCATGKYSAGGENVCANCTNAPTNSSYTGNASSNACPWSCNDGYNLTSDNQCGQFCESGITHIHLGNGLTVPLYSSARTSPAINVKWKDSICYGSLATGQSSGALNVKVGSTIYHATN